jgi:hypothetical protein
MTTKAPYTNQPRAAANALGILLAGFIESERESANLGWERVSGVLCLWPLSAMGVDDPGLEG